MVLAPPFKYFWNFHPEPADFLDGLVQPPTSFFFWGGGGGWKLKGLEIHGR